MPSQVHSPDVRNSKVSLDAFGARDVVPIELAAWQATGPVSRGRPRGSERTGARSGRAAAPPPPPPAPLARHCLPDSTHSIARPKRRLSVYQSSCDRTRQGPLVCLRQ
ncbi:unnamed protein product, partial [Iphiclides podalirius]